MSWFKKITGSDEEKPKEPAAQPSGGDQPAAQPQPGGGREHERFAGHGERMMIMNDDGSPGKEYEIGDISEGGFRVVGYAGSHRGNQYFEFKFSGTLRGEPVSITGFANVVRVKDDFLAAKFTSQGRVITFFRDYCRQ